MVHTVDVFAFHRGTQKERKTIEKTPIVGRNVEKTLKKLCSDLNLVTHSHSAHFTKSETARNNERRIHALKPAVTRRLPTTTS
jgi:hypothetical protein